MDAKAIRAEVKRFVKCHPGCNQAAVLRRIRKLFPCQRYDVSTAISRKRIVVDYLKSKFFENLGLPHNHSYYYKNKKRRSATYGQSIPSGRVAVRE